MPLSNQLRMWTETWRTPQAWLETLYDRLRENGDMVNIGGEYDRWDVEIRGGLVGSVRVLLATEDLNEGAQLLRLHAWPRWRALVLMFVLCFGLLAMLAAVSQAWIAAFVLGTVTVILCFWFVSDCAFAMASYRDAVTQLIAEYNVHDTL